MPKRAIASTALSLTLSVGLGACSLAHHQSQFQLPQAHQGIQVAQANILAAQSLTDAPQGLVLLTRAEPVLPPEEQEATLSRLATQIANQQSQQALAQAQAYTDAQAQALQAQAAQSNQATADQLRAYAEDVARRTITQATPEVQQVLRQQANNAIISQDEPVRYAINRLVEQRLTQASTDPVAQSIQNLATQATAPQLQKFSAQQQAELDKLRAENRQLVALLTQQQQTTAQQAGQAAQLAATAAELRAQAFTTQATTGAEERSKQFVLAQTTQTEERSKAFATSQAAQAEQQARSFTTTQVAALEDKYQQLANRNVAQVTQALQAYADQQLARLGADMAMAVQSTAEKARLDTVELQEATRQRLEQLQTEARLQANLAAQRTAFKLQTQLQQAKDQALTAQQVRALAQSTLDESAPQVRALALQALADSNDYIRTVARGAITDADPAVTEALSKAAQDVITKDNKVVFAIRQALEGAGTTPTTDPSRTVLGNAQAPSIMGADIMLSADQLRITPPGQPDDAGQGAGTGTRGTQSYNQTPIVGNIRNRSDWVNLRQYRVVVHEDARTLPDLFAELITKAQPYTGPWQVKWKISPANQELMAEKFSLDAETTFEQFVNYLSQHLVNDRGIKLTISLFDRERIMVISD